MSLSVEDIDRAVRHLRRADPVMRDVIGRAGPFTMKLKRDRFRALVYAILAQQISAKAAVGVRRKFLALVGPGGMTARHICTLTPDQLRSAGLSRQKASYVQDLARQVHEGQLALGRLGRLSDDEVIQSLIQVKGIGVWTAHMFLIFSLGRPDVLPHGDYGVRSAIQKLYELDGLPDQQTCLRIAAPWRPYASIASWYCWRSLDF